MNAAIRWFLIVAGLFVGLFFVAPLALPREWQAEAERVVPAPPAAVAALVGDLHRWPEWAPWGPARDPELSWEVAGSGREPGDVLHWSGRELGAGRLTLVAGGPGSGFVEYELAVAGAGLRSRGRIAWSLAPEGTRVHWRDGGPVQGPAVYRWFGGTLARAVTKEQAVALERLAARAAAAPGG